MSARARRLLVLWGGAALIIVTASCGDRPLGQAERLLEAGTLPLEEAYPGLAEKAESLAAAAELFWPGSPKVVLRMVDDDRTALGWNLVTEEKAAALWTYRKMRDRRQALEEDSRPYLLIPRHHLPGDYKAASPLPREAAGWADRQWLLWILREKFRLAPLAEGLDPALGEYLAYRGTAEALSRLKGLGSLELRQLKEEMHDKVAGAALVSDLAGQVTMLQARRSEDPSFAYETSRKKVVEAWQADFLQFYPRRFLTNLYLPWGSRILGDLEVIHHDVSAARWPGWDEVMAAAGGDVQEFLALMIKKP